MIYQNTSMADIKNPACDPKTKASCLWLVQNLMLWLPYTMFCGWSEMMTMTGPKAFSEATQKVSLSY